MLKSLTLFGKISLLIGIMCLMLGIFKLIQEINDDTFIVYRSMAIVFLGLGVGITIGSFLYKKD
ncbi:hypothetical protein [Virgibacillus ndiopensis]|uniref:hypothetical protein n=1 Tax=Virgibacillus ndiopensis TaxID=2004408 RepID=UPI000C06FDC2|nr:hypothetical protein [Virgibacillus ndiopensis]